MIKDDWSQAGIIYTRYLDVVTGEQLIESALNKSGDPRFDSIKFIVADWTQVKDTSISPQEVKELIACLQSISKITPNAVNASVIKINDKSTALTAFYRFLGENLSWKIEICETLDGANKMLGINIPKPEQLHAKEI